MVHSQDNGSENGQMLCMADVKRLQRPKPQRRTLSTTSNSSLTTHGDSGNNEFDSDLDSEAEEISWSIINREIHEWQYVCRTGRPFWWSPEFKMSTPSHRSREEASTRAWMREITDDSKPRLRNRYLTMDDSNLADSSDVQELARVIAVQLLGSCFTLAPEYLVPLPSAPTSYNRKGDSKLPDSTMISSLRMHTQFRYSPCFGHQARSTSPIQPWDCGGYDGSSTYSSPSGTGGVGTPLIVASESARGRKRLQKVHRALHVSEQSANDCSVESHSHEYLLGRNSTLIEKATIPIDKKLKDDHVIDGGRTSFSPHISGTDGRRHDTRCSIARNRPEVVPTQTADDANIDTSTAYRGVRPTLPLRTSYCLKPVLRSEPHHVIVLPVRELVVKRWKSIRRQFGGSLGTSLPRRASRDVESDSESDATSSILSTDARARRLRAQERGDIHSAGGEDDLHYNTPRSGTMTPVTSMEPFMIPTTPLKPRVALPVVMPISPFFRGTDPMAAFTSYPAGTRQPEHIMTPPDSFMDTGGYVSPNMIRTDPAAGAMFIQSSREPIVGSYRRRRTSMLSEMCTLEDFIGEMNVKRGRITQHEGSPHLVRANSSGTQIFRPDSDGIELDGMPVGPGREFWDGPVDNTGKRRERTYL